MKSMTIAQHHPKDIIGICSAAIIITFASCAIIAIWWTPYDPLAVDPSNIWQPASPTHPLGTDSLGRDLLSNIMAGSKASMLAAIVASAIAGILGLGIAALLEWLPRTLRRFAVRGIDIMIAFPTIIMAILLVSIFGASTLTAAISIGIGASAVMSRTLVPEIARAYSSDYTLAAWTSGAGKADVFFKHVVPAIRSTMLVRLSQIFGGSVLAESGLSYLGLGTPAPIPSWGRTFTDMQSQVFSRPWVLIAPGTCIVLLVLASNLFGNYVRDQLDPQLRTQTTSTKEREAA